MTVNIHLIKIQDKIWIITSNILKIEISSDSLHNQHE